MLERLRRNEVHVWYRFTEGLDADAVDRVVAVLSTDERQQYVRFRFERDRRDYAAAHALLRESLSRYVGVAPASWRFERTLDGKPVLARDHGFALAFNLSHTPGVVVCAITGGNDVGVDVESTTRRVDDDVARAVCSEEEYADVQAGASHSERSRRFSERWTLKEAYVKAIGKGLSHPLNTVTFALRADGSIAFASSMEAGRSWHFALFAPSDAYRIAVAVGCAPGMRPRFQLMTEYPIP